MIFIVRFRVRGKSSRIIGVNFDIRYYSSGIHFTCARIHISAFLIDRNDSEVVNFVLGNIAFSKVLENIFANILEIRILTLFNILHSFTFRY